MGQIVLGAAGAVVGGFVSGWNPTAMQAGWAIGSAIGAATAKGKTTVNSAQQMAELRVMGTEYGQCIPRVWGAAGIAGQMWWNSDRRPIHTYTDVTPEGGKGGGGDTQIQETITYEMDALYGLTDNEIVGVSRIWLNGKLIYSSLPDSSASTLITSIASEHWTRATVYTGSSTQLPDPTYEAQVVDDDGNLDPTLACAYRGRGYIFIEGLKLGQGGQVPNLTFEVVVDGFATSVDTWVTKSTPRLGNTTANFAAQAISPTLGIAVAVLNDGAGYKAAWSDDGEVWNFVPSADDSLNWVCVTWDDFNECFCALALSGGASMTSTDGETWTLHAGAAENNPWRSMCSGEILGIGYIWACSDGGATNSLAYSINGGTSFIPMNPLIGNGRWTAIAFADYCTKIIVGGRASGGAVNMMYSSVGTGGWLSNGVVGISSDSWKAIAVSEEDQLIMAVSGRAIAGVGGVLAVTSNPADGWTTKDGARLRQTSIRRKARRSRTYSLKHRWKVFARNL